MAGRSGARQRNVKGVIMLFLATITMWGFVDDDCWCAHSEEIIRYCVVQSGVDEVPGRSFGKRDVFAKRPPRGAVYWRFHFLFFGAQERKSWKTVNGPTLFDNGTFSAFATRVYFSRGPLFGPIRRHKTVQRFRRTQCIVVWSFCEWQCPLCVWHYRNIGGHSLGQCWPIAGSFLFGRSRARCALSRPNLQFNRTFPFLVIYFDYPTEPFLYPTIAQIIVVTHKTSREQCLQCLDAFYAQINFFSVANCTFSPFHLFYNSCHIYMVIETL